MQTEHTLEAIELAHRIFQESLVDEQGYCALDNNFFEDIDKLIEKFQETRALAEALR